MSDRTCRFGHDWRGRHIRLDMPRFRRVSIQREHFELARTQYDRASAINDRAERIQAKSDALMDRSGKVFQFVIPILVVLVAAAGWMLFRIM